MFKINDWLSLEKSKNGNQVNLHVLDRCARYEVGTYCFTPEEMIKALKSAYPDCVKQ